MYKRKRRSYDCSSNKLAFIFRKISNHCVRQLCKTNGAIKRYNRVEEQEQEQEREKIKEKKDKEKEI